MFPHHVLGLGWDELASILGIFSAILGGLMAWLVHTVNDNFRKNATPLNNNISKLNSVIESLKNELSNHSDTIDKAMSKLDKLDNKVVEHEVRINELERRNKHD